MDTIEKPAQRGYSPLLSHFQATAYDYIDVAEAFAGTDGSYQINELFIESGFHYLPVGNRWVADYILQRLHLDFPDFTSHLVGESQVE